jgi:signal-transduction protein with cAMP-binding, CBS, and nucleotidyltransferase domain
MGEYYRYIKIYANTLFLRLTFIPLRLDTPKMSDNFLNLFDSYVKLTDKDIDICKQYFELKSLPKNNIVEEENKVPKHLYFITKGFMRLFYYDDNGDEITTHIESQNQFITSFTNFIREIKSNENLECITNCEFYKIERSKLIELIEKNENFKNFSLVIFEQAAARTQIRANDFATLTADLRYKKLVEQQPEIIQNVPIQYIASYLGIKPQSLSRIRKQIIK